jgi:hypothetical protein
MKNLNKNILKFSAIIWLVGIPAALMANQITLTQNGNYSYDDGGEFTAVTAGQSFLGNGYVASTEVNGGFETFCVESDVYFYQNTSYNYTLNTSTDSDGEPLTEGAAFLYYEFATGQLSGYNYTPGSGRATTAGQLQAAIWYLMGGQLGDGYTASSILNDQYYLLALTTLGSSTIGSANNGDYGVDILELTDGNGNPAQNQLVLTGTTPHGNDLPVPDNYTTVIWFGASLGGLILIQSRQRQLVAKRN